MTDSPPDPPDAGFARALDAVMRPLVRVLIARGLTAPAFYRRLKRLYVEVAEAEFGLGGARATDSRITLLTGVHRRDVREMRAEGAGPDAAARAKATLPATVIGRWSADPALQDASGAPRPLPRSAEDGPSFEALVRALSTDIRPRTVLDELLRLGLVEMEEGAVRLAPDAVVGPGDPGRKVLFFGENLGDHMAAAADNLLGDAPAHLERAVFYNRLTPASAATIEAEARRLGLEALQEINRLAAERQDADRGAADDTRRIRFGVFFYQADQPPPPPPAQETDETEHDPH